MTTAEKFGIRPLHIFLWTCIAVGGVIRLATPFIVNPLDNLWSDCLRHFNNACTVDGGTLMQALDQLGFQTWLSTLMRVAGHDHATYAVANGLLSLATPWLWYRWMRECLSTKTQALIGYAIFSLWPNWISYFSYFVQETILLPLLGMSLWMSWRAVRKQTLGSYIVAALCFSAAIAAKATAAGIAVIVWAWMTKRNFFSAGLRRSLAYGALTAVLMATGYLVGPLKLHNRIGVWNFEPLNFNYLTFEGPQRDTILEYHYHQYDAKGLYREIFEFGSPSNFAPILSPFSDWRGWRKGEKKYLIDFTSVHPYPVLNISIAQRLSLTCENVIYFWFGHEWPVDTLDADDTWWEYARASVRWIWLPIAIAIVTMTIRQRRKDVLVVTCIAFGLLCTFQQRIISEGRYRLAWEGLAVVTMLSLLERKSKAHVIGNQIKTNALVAPVEPAIKRPSSQPVAMR